MIVNHDSGISRGFGFVTMQSKMDAKAVLIHMHELEVLGQRIYVQRARNKMFT